MVKVIPAVHTRRGGDNFVLMLLRLYRKLFRLNSSSFLRQPARQHGLRQYGGSGYRQSHHTVGLLDGLEKFLKKNKDLRTYCLNTVWN